MAVNELERDFLRILHECDMIESVIAGLKMEDATDVEKKQSVGNIVMKLETDMLDDKWATAGKDCTRINEVIAAGRTYWKS